MLALSTMRGQSSRLIIARATSSPDFERRSRGQGRHSPLHRRAAAESIDARRCASRPALSAT
jgi:hypothetical protein